VGEGCGIPSGKNHRRSHLDYSLDGLQALQPSTWQRDRAAAAEALLIGPRQPSAPLRIGQTTGQSNTRAHLSCVTSPIKYPFRSPVGGFSLSPPAVRLSTKPPMNTWRGSDKERERVCTTKKAHCTHTTYTHTHTLTNHTGHCQCVHTQTWTTTDMDMHTEKSSAASNTDAHALPTMASAHTIVASPIAKRLADIIRYESPRSKQGKKIKKKKEISLAIPPAPSALGQASARRP